MSYTEENTTTYSENELIKYHDNYLLPEYYPMEMSAPSAASLHPRWRNTPRSPADFFASESSSSCCRDSDYEAWLEKYYQDLFKEQTKSSFDEKAVDTSDLVDEKKEKILTSLFPPIREGPWSYSTKYWGPKDVRRHWPLRIKRGEYRFLPSIHPHLNVRSRHGRYHTMLNSAAAVPEVSHKKVTCSVFKRILQGTLELDPQLTRIMLCDTLCNFKWFDAMSKTMVTRCLCRLLRKQCNMEKVYLENTDLGRMEGIILLCALSRNGGDLIKEIHMWKMFGYGQCPLLLNELSRKGELLPIKESTEFFTKVHYLEILNKFSSLTHLSINYAYLANRNGDALLNLRCLRVGCLEKLRILCLMEERPLRTNPGYGVGGWKIPDGVWRRVTEWCPQLRVSFVFLNIPQYENIILFLSKNIPMSHVYISSGVDFTFEVPWDVDSTLLELRNWYSSTLENLCLHLWHHRDLLDFVIKRKILEEFPNLINFEFIGVLESVETLEEFCCQLSRGTYKLKTLLFWVEEEYTDRKKLELTRRRVREIREKYRKKFQVIDIDADLQTYVMSSDNGRTAPRAIDGPNEPEPLCLDNWEKETNADCQLCFGGGRDSEGSLMNGKHLIVSVSSIPPYVQYTQNGDDVVLQGSVGHLWRLLEERLGFSSQYMIETYTSGVLNFRNGRRDVLLRPSVLSSDDVDNFDFTFPIASTWYELYLKDSDEINSSISYVRNWSMGIWLFTGGMLVLFTALLCFTLRLAEKLSLREVYTVPAFDQTFEIVQYLSLDNAFTLPKNWRKTKRDNWNLKRRNDMSLGNCFLSAISAFCSQGSYLHSTLLSTRLLVLSFLIFGMIMFNSYSALLVSQLTLGERFLPFDTLDEIPVKDSKYSLCVRPESYPYSHFTVNNTRSKLQKKWQNIINRKPCPEDGKFSPEDMCHPYVAFLEAPAVMSEAIQRNLNCKMTNLKGRYFHVDLSLMILKGFEESGRRELNMEVARYREVGILSYLEEKWIRKREPESGASDKKLQVTFEHIEGILMVYTFCLGFSSCVFLLESAYHLKRSGLVFERRKTNL